VAETLDSPGRGRTWRWGAPFTVNSVHASIRLQ
jgi:hypothetical protein